MSGTTHEILIYATWYYVFDQREDAMCRRFHHIQTIARKTVSFSVKV